MARVTIRDVAKAAAVAPSTVSLYMRGMNGVARDTGRRIASAMDRLGYEPDIRRPKEPEGGLVALVLEQSALASLSGVFYDPIIKGIEFQARFAKLGVLLVIAQEGELASPLQLNLACGALVLGQSSASRAIAEQMLSSARPLVLVDHYYWDLPTHAILPDNHAGGYLAVKHLLELGHRRIAILPGSPKYHTLSDRAEGAARALLDHGLRSAASLRPNYASTGRPDKGYKEMQGLLRAKEPPTAVFAVSDRTALGAIRAIRDAGLRIPEDISLVGYDHVADTEPALTTIAVPRREMGRIAMLRYAQILQDGIGLPTRTSVQVELIVGSTTTEYKG